MHLNLQHSIAHESFSFSTSCHNFFNQTSVQGCQSASGLLQCQQIWRPGSVSLWTMCTVTITTCRRNMLDHVVIRA